MSMLSAQADELRELALWLDDEFYDEYATRARDAADTILSLRDKAQELQAENAKLRKQLEESVHDATMAWDRALKAESVSKGLRMERDVWQKNDARLRELADSSYTFAFNCYHGVFDQEAFFRLREKYRDSGIEVDE